MGKINTVLHSLSTGEVSIAALSRVDHEKLRLAAEIQENLFPHVIGKGQVRPGTQYIGATASNNKARYMPFVKGPSDTALIEMTSALMRVWISDTLLTRPSVTSSLVNGTFATASATITVTIATPGVVTWTAHGLSANAPVSFETTGALPTGLTEGTIYYVVGASITADTFQVSATSGGAAINTSGSQSGTHTGYHGWGVVATSGASATITGGELQLQAPARGSSVYAEQAVTTSSAGTEHALRITVTRGPVRFRCGSSSGAQDYITETTLDTGIHSLAFTPTGTYYARLIKRDDKRALIDSVAVEGSGTVTIAAPWSESDLPLVRWAQSIDTVFLACQSWQQRKIERRGATGRSWSLAKYETNDGPFVTADTNKIRLTLGAQYGVTTLTASTGLFTSSHVGALVRLFPQSQSYTFNLAGEDVYTEALRLSGIGTSNDLTYAITGTWSGTISREMNYDDGTDGFTEAGTHTINASGTEASGSDHDNVIHYVRYGFRPGAYTSGTATVNIANTGGGKAGVVRIVAFNSTTSVDVQVLSPPGSVKSTDNWQFGAWSDVAGWPSAVALFDGRLWWGGEDKFWGSESDNYYAFNLDDEGASGSIQRALATGGTINRAKWMLPLQRLIFGTDGAEISARSSSFDEPLTPTNVTIKDASTHGAAAYSPAKLDGRGVYIHRDGLRSFEVVYEAESNDYRARSLTLFNETIGGSGLTGLAIQRSPETYVWHVRADGQCPVLLYDIAEKTAGWFQFIAAASAAGAATVEDVVVLPTTSVDRVYLQVKRTINGSTVRYLEKLAKHSEAEGGTGNRMLDSYVHNAGPITTFTGLGHLVGETVAAWGTYNGVTGKIGTTFTVNGSGEITLPGSCTNVTVGLVYNWRYKSARLAYAAEGGTALLMPKRIDSIGLLAANIHPAAVRSGMDFTTTYEMPRVERGQAITATTVQTVYDERTWAFGGGWDTDSRVCLKGSAPYPATILAIVTGIETNET